MATLGVVVFSFDGMKHLAQCLESVAWADRVMLLHAGNCDTEVGREFPALSVRRLDSWGEAEGYCAEIGSDWVLYLWGDERVDDALAEELRGIKSRVEPDSARAYRLPVRSYILNRWVEGGLTGPSPALRLSRGNAMPSGWWMSDSDAAEISRGWIEDRGSGELAAAVERVQALSDFWAARLIKVAEPPRPLKTIFAALRVKIKMLLGNRIFGRGLAGVALAALASYSVLLSGAKLWEARRTKTQRAAK